MGVLYNLGKGVNQDYKKANELYSEACDLGFGDSCYNLGVLYFYGKGVGQDANTAKKYLNKACDLGSKAGCDGYRKLNELGF